jgi:arylsulfatase A-like enzyme
MTDDQAQGALSVCGNRILKTPNVDRIGNEGIRFDEAFVTTSVCAPSRAFYDVEQDPDEMANLIDAPEHAEHIARLKTRITELCAETGDVDPPGYSRRSWGQGNARLESPRPPAPVLLQEDVPRRQGRACTDTVAGQAWLYF